MADANQVVIGHPSHLGQRLLFNHDTKMFCARYCHRSRNFHRSQRTIVIGQHRFSVLTDTTLLGVIWSQKQSFSEPHLENHT